MSLNVSLLVAFFAVVLPKRLVSPTLMALASWSGLDVECCHSVAVALFSRDARIGGVEHMEIPNRSDRFIRLAQGHVGRVVLAFEWLSRTCN